MGNLLYLLLTLCRVVVLDWSVSLSLINTVAANSMGN